MSSDAITEELFRIELAALADEMALTIYRTSYSDVLKNIMDYSAALCDAAGRLAAQGLSCNRFSPATSRGLQINSAPRESPHRSGFCNRTAGSRGPNSRSGFPPTWWHSPSITSREAPALLSTRRATPSPRSRRGSAPGR
ncbi:MAG: hydantoinase B/oxoprolinase family protein [Acetobacteraceae bacterium]